MLFSFVSPQRLFAPHQRWRRIYVTILACLLLLCSPNSPLVIGNSTAYAASMRLTPPKTTPNRFDPRAGAQSVNQPYTPAPLGPEKAHAPQPISHQPAVSMKAGSVDLHAGQAAHFLGSDGHLELTIPANAITASDLVQAGGKLTLRITQVAPASGSNAGGSGHLSLGTYLFQLVDAHGNLVNHGLRQMVTASYHYTKPESALNLSHVYTILNGALPQSAGLVRPSSGVDVRTTFGAPQTLAARVDSANRALLVSPLLATPSTSMSWNSDASISTFGKPDLFNVDINAGSLTASFPIDLPAGPGGLLPPLALSYSSESVTEQHNPTGAAGWVGEGWNLSLGSVNWAEHNVLSDCQSSGCGTNWENAWQISDPFGTSSELIPPNINVSTYFDDTPNDYCGTGSANAFPCPILWHTATETHAKIYSYVGPVNINMPVNPPCFRAWLANGIMEEFGCTADSLQYYYIPGVGFVVSGWNLDLITDPQGNQVHVTYQRDLQSVTATNGQVLTYPRDSVLSTIEYDSPNCHNAQTMCTGSNWAPLAQVNFQASNSVMRLTGPAPTGCNTGAGLRCDDPFDLSGSGGTAAPQVLNTFVLNDIQVQIRSSGTASWNTLHDYKLGYEQSAPTTVTDPATGKSTSTAGMLDLTKIQEVGAGGANALMYSGLDNSATSSYAYMKVFDLSAQHVVVSPNTTLSYWVYPQSGDANFVVSGNNSTCVAMDIIFTDGSNLRDSGAVDQNGNRVHPALQCGHLNLDQWNLVTTNIGAVANGKTISKLDIAYDQPANTGGYRGYFDDISLSNPTSSTPLFATGFESGDPQPTWTDTVDTGPEAGAGNISNVGGICCGLTGPEAGVRQEAAHGDSAALPGRTFTYTSLTNYYEDDQFHPNPTTNCGPSWNTGNGSGCLLWSQSYANNSRYLTSASNGMGMAQSFSYALARNNTHGVPGGGSNNADPLYCNSHQSGYPCNEADDQNWSHVVLMQDSSTTIRLTQNGQGGQQTSTPVTNTSSYIYQLSYPLIAQECGDCVAGMYWGNQNDGDYLGYYNGKFMGFAQTTVSLSDGAKEVHKYFATEGYGLYDMSQVTCFASTPCHAAPWWHLNNAAHGHEYEAFFYDTDGQTLLKHDTTTYQAVCPPSGVGGTPAYTAWGNWDGQLVSALDHNNPVAACDIQATQQVSETRNGSGNIASTTTASTYDSFGRVTQDTVTSNGGSPSQMIYKTAYVWNDAVTATQSSASGTYITDAVAFTDTEDGSGNRLACTYTSYDGQGYLTGQTAALTSGQATTETKYASCGTAANSYTPSGPSTTTTSYDLYGNTIGTNDADANSGISGHTGCTVSSVQHTNCTTYDSTFAVYPITTANVLNQTSSTSYANTGTLFGFGIWPASTTDANGQTTSVTYDALGRMTGEALPGETSGVLTKQWVYTNWCSGTAAQSPCTEIDEIDRVNSSTTLTTRAFYDGEERLVETRAPGFNGQDVVIYAYYDNAGRQVFKSNPYFVPAYTGTPSAAAYSIPDRTQPGTSTSYPNRRTTSVTDPNSHTSTTTVSVICGVSGTSDTGCYVQSMVVDANGHQSATLTGGQGKRNYAQSYTGTSGSATLYATTAYTYDAAGNLLSTKSQDGSTTNAVYDTLGRVTSQSDPDRGTTAFTYDPNGNVTQSVDARGSVGTVFTGYDGLNRPLWKNSANSPTGALASYTYDSTANSNNGVGRLTGENFTGNGGLSGSYAYTYDGRGQEVNEVVTVNGTSYTLQTAYNDHGQVSSQTYPTGEVVTPGYSSTGWLASLTTQTGSTITTVAANLAYSGLAGAAGKITAMSFGNGANYAASYDFGMRLTSASLTQTSTNAVVYSTQPIYDAASNVTSVQTNISSATDAQQFCYDSLDRLTWAGATGTPPCVSLTPGTLTAAQYQQSDTYNVVNGLVTGPAGSYTYGSSSHPHAVTATGNGYSAAYDPEGNLTCRAPSSVTTCNGTQTGQQLSYDIEGRLSTWQNQPGSPSSTASYLYDGAGNRVAMQSTVNGMTTLTAYIGSIEEVRTTGGATTTTTYYAVSGTRIAAKVNGTLYYFGYDALSSQVAVLDSSGNLVGSQLYGPYGNSRYSSGTLPTSIGFTGQQSDSVSGLDYYVARYYDPVVGQFLAADTVQGNSQGTDPYAYVGGNPETRTDPSGHCWPICTAIIGGIIGAAVGATVGIVHEAAQHGTNFGSYNWGSVAVNAGVGAVAGALVGTGVGAMAIGASGVVAGGAAVGLSASASMTLASVTTAAAIGAGTGAVSSAIGAYAGHQSFANGLQSVFEGASIGAISSAATAWVGGLGALGARAMFSGGAGLGRALLQGGIQAAGGFVSDVTGQVWDNYANGRKQSIDWGSSLLSGGIGFVGGFTQQLAFNRWHLPGASASSRAARAFVNNRRWFWQGIRASAASGVIQGGLQGVRTIAPAMTSSPNVNYVGRVGRRFMF